MNLEDVIDPEAVNSVHSLQQDEWSLSKPRFGEEGQLEVVGWSGRSGSNKYYILKCSKCSQDSELFGGGYFRSLKSSLVKGGFPCGCSSNTKWSQEQFYVLCSRKAKELGYKFLGFVGEWKGQTTKIKMLCEKHGEWSSGVIQNLISNGRACPECGAEAVRKAKTKPDNVMIASFHEAKAFHPDTKFWRSERKDSHGRAVYWYVSCPVCSSIGESQGSDLQKGGRPCKCGRDSIGRARKPDDVMIASFHEAKAFHPDTKFWRSERLDGRGYTSYWHMSCPECGEVGESTTGHLQAGCRPCACSPMRQQECYINWVVDEHNNAVGIKFGIARDSKQRIKNQNRQSVYEVRQYQVYTFPSVQQCKQAERECKKELECGVVLKRDMPDGWTETTWSYNIGKVKSIYERNGGVLE